MSTSQWDDPGIAPMPVVAVSSDEAEEPPGSRGASVGKRHPHWHDVPQHEWEDWRWQMRHAIRSTSQLASLLPFADEELAILESLDETYKTAIPPYYFSLIDPENPSDPIRLQAVPSIREAVSISGQMLEDPLEEDKDSPVPGITHRYPDRCLLVTTPVCSMYCRFCTRKRMTMDREGWDAPSRDDERMMEYVAAHPEIHDVIVSGGDPLMLPPAKLNWFLTQLAAIDHVDVIRVGSRVPVTLPMKLFDPELLDILRRPGKVWIQTHFNHPNEMTPEASRAVRNLVNAGLPVNNHSVLLKGVNDSVATMRGLMRALLRNKVRPYYLFHCDPVTGAGHFRTSVWKGLEIMEGLRGHMSGLGVPTYVVDGLHGAGKIPLMPNYLVSASENAVVLRNYEGLLFRYAPEDKEGAVPEGIATTGVSNLLSGTAKVLMPEGTPRIERRAQRAAAAANLENTALAGLANLGTPHGCSGEASALADLTEGPVYSIAPPKSRTRASRSSNGTNGTNGNRTARGTNGTNGTNGVGKMRAPRAESSSPVSPEAAPQNSSPTHNVGKTSNTATNGPTSGSKEGRRPAK